MASEISKGYVLQTDLLEKAAHMGIESSFVDATGKHQVVNIKTLEAIVASLPDRRHSHIFNSPLISRDGESVSRELAETVDLPLAWKVIDAAEDAKAKGFARDHRLALPTMPQGIYRVEVRDSANREDEVSLLSVPRRAFAGAFNRVWILAIQLYSVKSSRNWGMGDFTDLEALLQWAAKSGAAGLGLNPLHVLFDNHPEDCSPYAPSSRLFLNPLYIDVVRLPEFPNSFGIEHAEHIERARSAELVDYSLIADLKLNALRQAFRIFRLKTTLRRKTSFEEYRQRQGPLLLRFACFEVLRRKYSGPWWTWPEGWSTPDDTVLNEFRGGPDATDIEFFEFVQWIADQQLTDCRDLAVRLNLPVGLYLDIAVGVKADGFDAWNEQVAISRNLAVGAPPDLINTAGQDWGLAGFNAVGLELRLYKPFEDVLNASMQYAGAVRLDHVLGLNRLYLVPAGYPPTEGAYVQMPLEALLAVTALASVNNNCVVIGEDLGTVPDGFRERLEDWGVLSYRVMMFERGYDGGFHPAECYPQNALLTFNTHDLPTFLGWNAGHDIQLKRSLGIDPGEDQEARATASKKLAEALKLAQLDDASFYSTIRYLTKAKSRILGLSIDDLLKVKDQPNVPGTIDEHPNWRRRLPVPMESWEDHIDADLLRSAVGDRYLVNALV